MSHSESIYGVYYDGRSSQRHACELHVDDGGLVSIHGIAWAGCHLSRLDIPSRVGNTARLIRLPDGGYFETTRNDAVDRLLRRQRQGRWRLTPYRIESSLGYTALAAVLMLVVAFASVQWLIPYAARQVAASLPPALSEQVALGTLEQLDENYLHASELPESRRQALRDLFREHLPDSHLVRYRLLFRDSGVIGANAFALPDGTVLVTDELVRQSGDDLEVLSVLLHEMGHVERHHGLRRVLEGMGVAALVIWLTGDMEAMGEWVAVLPTILVHQSYSRDHEREADTYALERMLAAGYDPAHFADFMVKVMEGGEQPGKDEEWVRFLSSHPPSEERIRRFREASEAFRASRARRHTDE